ncbi:unnamed protein product [Ectocarpus sp. 8 AP-2014]
MSQARSNSPPLNSPEECCVTAARSKPAVLSREELDTFGAGRRNDVIQLSTQSIVTRKDSLPGWHDFESPSRGSLPTLMPIAVTFHSSRRQVNQRGYSRTPHETPLLRTENGDRGRIGCREYGPVKRELMSKLGFVGAARTTYRRLCSIVIVRLHISALVQGHRRRGCL